MFPIVERIDIKELKPHPLNNTFFDDMPKDKWDDFLDSIRTSGIIEPIVVTKEYVIVSGHQRWKAAKELKFHTVPVLVKEYDNDDAVIKDLIETNIRQRGTINSSSVKSAKIIKTLESIYKADKKSKQSGETFTLEDLAARLGISKRTLGYIKSLDSLPKEMLELIENKKITPTTALKAMEGLTPDEQAQIIAMIQSSGDKKVTGRAIKDYAAQIFDKDSQITQMEYQITQQNAEIKRLQEKACDNKKRNYGLFLRAATFFRDNLETLSHAGVDPKYIDVSQLTADERNELSLLISTINKRLELVYSQLLKSGEDW